MEDEVEREMVQVVTPPGGGTGGAGGNAPPVGGAGGAGGNGVMAGGTICEG
ncbi:hypothetical protein FRB95_002536 [Tulasnella sp. JGI-2019a]|nr:hypothetical protein FRB95_002536 [Tulasnella sp. JGI-2019a]